MNLLDTHVLVWAINEPERLSDTLRRILTEDEYVVSAASLWELIAKRGKPTAPVRDPRAWWLKHVASRSIRILPIEWQHTAYLDTLPAHHKDPFDRIIICQAIVERMRLLSVDAKVRQYRGAVDVVW